MYAFNILFLLIQYEKTLSILFGFSNNWTFKGIKPMYFYFISHFLFFIFFQDLKRKSILINSHSHHPLQSIWVGFQLKSDCSRQITQRYFVFPYFISAAMKKHFLNVLFSYYVHQPKQLVASAAQNKLTQTPQADLSLQVKAVPPHYLKSGASVSEERHYAGVHFN